MGTDCRFELSRGNVARIMGTSSSEVLLELR